MNYDGIDDLAQSIKEHGQMRPIEIDQHNIITDGHRRFRALKKLKRDCAWVVVVPVKNHSEKKIRQYSHEAHDRKVTTSERDEAWYKLQKSLKLTAPAFAKKMGVSKSTIEGVKDRAKNKFPPALVEAAGVTLIRKSQCTNLTRNQRIELLNGAVRFGWENQTFGKMCAQWHKLHPKVQKAMFRNELHMKDTIKMAALPHEDQISKLGVLIKLTEIRENFNDVVEEKREVMVPGRRTLEVKAAESIVNLTKRLFDVVHSTELATGICKMLKAGIESGGELDPKIQKNIKGIVKLSQQNMCKLGAEMKELEGVL